MSTQEQRERFEAWKNSDSNWFYIDVPENAFAIWFAAEAAAIEEAAQLCERFMNPKMAEAIRALLKSDGAKS